MATEVLVKSATPVCWANAGDYSSTVSGITRTHAIDLTSLANGAARQGAKADLGATRPERYSVKVGLEIDVAPVAGVFIEYYWSSSFSTTAGTGNDGGASGTDAAYKAGEEDEWKKQLTFIGSLVCTADAAGVVQIQVINEAFRPPTRYGMPVVLNKSGQALEGDAIEAFVALLGIVDEVQD